jgi:hypothetical protein
VHHLGELVELAPVSERNADELGDQVGRQLARDVGNEVAFAARKHGVDDHATQLSDARLEPRDAARREAAVHEPAQARVGRRVHAEEHQTRLLEVDRIRLRRWHVALQRRGEELRVARHRDHVGVFGDHPDAARDRVGVPEDRRLAPQRCEHLVGRSVRERRGVEQVGDLHRPTIRAALPSPCRAAP